MYKFHVARLYRVKSIYNHAYISPDTYKTKFNKSIRFFHNRKEAMDFLLRHGSYNTILARIVHTRKYILLMDGFQDVFWRNEAGQDMFLDCVHIRDTCIRRKIKC